MGSSAVQWAQFTLAETTRLVAPSGEWLRDETVVGQVHAKLFCNRLIGWLTTQNLTGIIIRLLISAIKSSYRLSKWFEILTLNFVWSSSIDQTDIAVFLCLGGCVSNCAVSLCLGGCVSNCAVSLCLGGSVSNCAVSLCLGGCVSNLCTCVSFFCVCVCVCVCVLPHASRQGAAPSKCLCDGADMRPLAAWRSVGRLLPP